ncbi:MAG: BON domain-containing protein [Gammaproteobacteria bacterium]|nr:BON domain-containing protein [Gammaproteobacteria bacterium]
MRSDEVLEQVRIALRSDPRVDLGRYPIDMHFDAGVLTLSGEVGTVAAKKLALERAAALECVNSIVDRLHIMPTKRSGDGVIRHHIRDGLLGDPAMRDCSVRVRVGATVEMARDLAPGSPYSIEISVNDGVATLDGEVPSLCHKRLAGVLAWWIPSCRDVINGLAEVPAQQDDDGELVDAVQLVLERNRLVDATHVKVSAEHYIVTLEGYVTSREQRAMTESDAWYVFGVDDVRNKLEVRP